MNDTITIVGTIGTDPEKKIRNGVPITTFRVASKERRFDRSTGAWVDGETTGTPPPHTAGSPSTRSTRSTGVSVSC